MRKMIVSAIVLSGLWIAVPSAPGALISVDSAADQYAEYIPGVTGRGDGNSGSGASDGNSRSGASDQGSSSLPKHVIKQLEQQGDDGVAAAILAQSSAPPVLQEVGPGSPKKSNLEPGDHSTDAALALPILDSQGAEASGFSAVVSNIGSNGMGMALPLLLLLVLVGVISIRIVEARASGGKPQN